MADETGQVGYAASRLHRLLTLTTNCHLAQDILSYFTGITLVAPDWMAALRLPMRSVCARRRTAGLVGVWRSMRLSTQSVTECLVAMAAE